MAWVEQYPFTNPEFEDPGKTQAWIPAGWTLTTSDSLWAYAAFDDHDRGGSENFEGGWGRAAAYPTDATALGWRHKTTDRSDLSGMSIDELSDCQTTANAVKAVANAHFGDTAYHVAGDSRTISAADATNLATLITLVNELFTDCDAHAADATPTWHTFKGYGFDRPLDTGTATDLDTARNRLSMVLVAFGRHLWWRGLTYRWTEFAVLSTLSPPTDPTAGYLLVADTFDLADTGTAESWEDYEEGWTSLYLTGGVQAALGTNEDRVTEMIPTPGTFSQGQGYDSFEQGWPEWRHKAEDTTDLDNQDVSTQSACYVVANSLKAVMNAHFPSTTLHKAADPRTITADNADDLAKLITLVNEEYTDSRAHALDASALWHLHATDNLDVPDSAQHPASDFPTAQGVLATLLLAFGRHLWWRGTDHIWTEFAAGTVTDIDATSMAYLEQGRFDVANDLFEDFEEEWSDNEDRLTQFTIPTNLTLASFYGAAGAETFDAKRSYNGISTTPGTASTPLPHDKTMGFYFENTGTFVATYSLQVRRSDAGSWITYDEFDAVTAFEIPPGYVESRVMCVAHTSGSMTATAHWERMDVF